MKYIITIEYDGSKYNGLQKLKNKVTVQGELETLLSKLDEKPVSVKASGRTDKGVHALNQTCHFELAKKITPYRLKYYLNRSTSPYLYVKTCKTIIDEDFHARFFVKSKTYLYKINIGEYSAIQNDYVYNYNEDLDINLMQKAANSLIGPHNYKAFVTGKHKTYDSIIDNINIEQKDKIITIKITGQAFYTYMVRNIVSSLVLVGNYKLTLDELKDMLNNQKRVIEYPPAPANGLYLEKIEY